MIICKNFRLNVSFYEIFIYPKFHKKLFYVVLCFEKTYFVYINHHRAFFQSNNSGDNRFLVKSLTNQKIPILDILHGIYKDIVIAIMLFLRNSIHNCR